MYDILFEKQKFGTLEVPNRMVMTAMGNHYADAEGYATETDINFYAARAKGGVGTIITECLAVDPKTGIGNHGQMLIDDDKYIPALTKLTDAVHQYGSAIVAQIYHPGRQQSGEPLGMETVPSASAIPCGLVGYPAHEMTHEEINYMVNCFAQAARRVKAAGFDAVEVHAAHGYLINAFLSPLSNVRTDEYGGSQENRMRFLKEIIEAIKAECGEDYPIIVRISGDEHMEYVGKAGQGITTELGVEIAKYLESYGIAALNVSSGNYETMNTAWEPVGFDQGWKLATPKAIKAAVSIPVIATGVLRDPSFVVKSIEDGAFDLMGSARSFVADPEWPNKVKEGRIKDIRKCISCLYCMESFMAADFTGGQLTCAVNHEAGREGTLNEDTLKKDGKERSVVVIGAGPAGLEAARILAMRGFKPVVFEKEAVAGGNTYYASLPPKKRKTGWIIDYLVAQMEKYEVPIYYNTTPTIEDIKEQNPYAVFVANGSKPIMPRSIPGLDGEFVYTPYQVLSGEVNLEDKNVAMIGSGMTGIETTEYLLAKGNKVEVIEMAADIGPGVMFQNLIDVMSRVGSYGTPIHTNTKLCSIDGRMAIVEDVLAGEQREVEFDAYVISLGTVANKDIMAELEENFERVIRVCDPDTMGRIEAATRIGYEAAFNLE